MPQGKTFYDVLGVSKDASDKEIKTAFRKLAQKHHPDAGGDEAKFKEISEAYDTLSNPEKRKEYDQMLMFGGMPGAGGAMRVATPAARHPGGISSIASSAERASAARIGPRVRRLRRFAELAPARAATSRCRST